MAVGRPRTPIPLRVAQGNPAHRPIPEVAEFPTGAECPAWLSRDAKKEGKRIAPMLHDQGLLTAADQAMLTGYCEAYGTVAECRRILNRAGYTTMTDKGSVVTRPEARVLNAALTHLHRYAVEFGFSPASLSRVKPIPKEKEVDPMEALLSGG